MKERVTFVHGANDPFTPEQLRLDNDTLCVKSLKAAREDRSTFGLHELPQEVSLASFIYLKHAMINSTDGV